MKVSSEPLDQASVRQYCKALRVPVVGANFIALAEQAVKEKRNHVGYREALLAIYLPARAPRAATQLPHRRVA
jgi:hypothetical protein